MVKIPSYVGGLNPKSAKPSLGFRCREVLGRSYWLGGFLRCQPRLGDGFGYTALSRRLSRGLVARVYRRRSLAECNS
jgi:hypothetical protein